MSAIVSENLTFDGNGITDAGLIRDRNDDAYFVDTQYGLAMVCDGVSGHAAGNEASQKTIEEILKFLKNDKSFSGSTAEKTSYESLGDIHQEILDKLKNAVSEAGQVVYQTGQRDLKKAGMSTTLELIYLRERYAYLAHVGDSRIYLVRGDTIHRLTNDHTYVAELIKSGKLKPENAANSPYAHVLMKAVGISKVVQADTLVTEISPGDVFVLCTDGLTDVVKEQDILDVVKKHPEKEVSQILVNMAKDRKSKDNITVVCLKVQGNVSEEAKVSPSKKLETLAKIPLFRYLTYPERIKVLSISKTLQFQTSTEFVKEGEIGDQFFIILSGKVGVMKNGVQIQVREAGDSVGEMSIIDQGPRSASLLAATPVTVVAISRKSLFQLLREDTQIGVKLLWALAAEVNKKLRDTTEKLVSKKQTFEIEQDDELPFSK